MSFDGDELWIGDVGQGAREEVTIATIGSNHGWAWFEGFVNGPKFNNTINGATRTGGTFTDPVYDYTRGNGQLQGNSITGGIVYRGTNIPGLTGKYIFCDYATGNIWSLERTETPGDPDVERIAGEGGIAGFGPDPSNGDILLADLNNGLIQRLVARDVDPSFPDTLTATGIFSDLANLTPNPGVVPYGVNLPFWSDHAFKQTLVCDQEHHRPHHLLRDRAVEFSQWDDLDQALRSRTGAGKSRYQKAHRNPRDCKKSDFASVFHHHPAPRRRRRSLPRSL